MGDTTIITGPEQGPNLIVFRWMWQRYGYIYYSSTLGFLVTLAFMMLITGHTDTLSWPHNPMPSYGVFVVSMLTGLTILYQLRDNAASFLLARPFSRRQVYHAVVMGALFFWFVLAVLPNLGTMIMALRETTRLPYQAGYDKEMFFIAYVFDTLACTLLTINIVILSYIPNSRSLRVRYILAWCFITLLMFVAPIVVAGAKSMVTLGPILTGSGVVLTVFFYQMGWRLFRNLEY